jgi:hypothetical protein
MKFEAAEVKGLSIPESLRDAAKSLKFGVRGSKHVNLAVEAPPKLVCIIDWSNLTSNHETPLA